MEQLDPLNSPHPIPWTWILATQAAAIPGGEPFFYRSETLLSPDGEWAAYSRVRLDVSAELWNCRVSSVLFLENLHTKTLQIINARSPLAQDPWRDNAQGHQAGAIAVLHPVGWSRDGQKLLAREFEGLFCSSTATDYAVVWDRQLGHAWTCTPTGIEYDIAILQGWSAQTPGQMLFKTLRLGDRHPQLHQVDIHGVTQTASEDWAEDFGQHEANLWTGPQAHR